MNRRSFLLTLGGAAAAAAAETEKGFQPLFDGKTLNGWKGDPRLWSVKDGEIVGSTDGIQLEHNSFLIYEKRQFGDFIFRCQVKLRNHNSGVQFRSEELPDYVVKGYQADMAEGNWWGGVYEEKGTRGVMVNGWDKAQTVLKPNDFNDLEIYAKGDLIRITLNGLQTAELHDSLKLKGILALQLHKGPGMKVEFRNLRIKTL